MMVTEAAAGGHIPMIEEAEGIKLILLAEEISDIDKTKKIELVRQARIRERFGITEIEQVDDSDIVDTRVIKEMLITPEDLAEALPMSRRSAETTRNARYAGSRILKHLDDRVMFWAGGCSIHDPEDAIEFAQRFIVPWRRKYSEDVEVGMRTYFEKPRTPPKKDKKEGWKGLTYDPRRDRSDDISLGLVLTRLILCRITDLGVPTATERLNPLTPQYTNGLITHDVTGARSTTDPKSREVMAGSSAITAFKNTLDGSIEAAIAAAAGARHLHSFVGMEINGRVIKVRATGNTDSYIILRGSDKGPNYGPEYIAKAKELCDDYGIEESLGVDFAHMNSFKKAKLQIEAATETTRQISQGEEAIRSVWTESNLVPGRQNDEIDKELVPGQSITDECIGPEESEEIIAMTASAVRQRRKVARSH